jgi:hypothetical protein
VSEKTIAQKLLIKDDRTLLLVNAPRGYANVLGPLPTDAKLLKSPAKRAGVIQLFVANRAELETRLPQMKAAVAPGDLLWVTYYKGTAQIRTDIGRDALHAYARTLGMEGVSLVSIDDDWSAMRFKLL